MRIIAGQKRGLTLLSFDVESIRPTKDMVKEFMFNCLANCVDISESSVLDLFAGTGSLGIEALSRGAKEAVFIDEDSRSIDLISKNVARSGFTNVKIVQASVQDWLNTCKWSYNVVFVDPPYGETWGQNMVKLFHEKKYLADGGCLVLETGKEDKPDLEGLTSLELYKQKRWGETLVTICQKNS